MFGLQWLLTLNPNVNYTAQTYSEQSYNLGQVCFQIPFFSPSVLGHAQFSLVLVSARSMLSCVMFLPYTCFQMLVLLGSVSEFIEQSKCHEIKSAFSPKVRSTRKWSRKKVPFVPHDFEKYYIFLLLRIHNLYKYTKAIQNSSLTRTHNFI